MTQKRSSYDDSHDEKHALAHLQSNLDSEYDDEDVEDSSDDEDSDDLSGQSLSDIITPVKPLKELTVEQILERADSNKEFDLFEDVGAPLVERGDRVKYTVRLNGEMVGSFNHPCSYEWLQKKYGGGSYSVVLRSYLFSKKPGGGYLKSQSRMVAAPKEEDMRRDAPIPYSVPAPVSSEKGSNNMELLTILQSMNEKTRAEQRAEMDRIREESRAREERLEREARIREERLEKEAKEREAKRESESGSTLAMFMKMMDANAKAASEASARQNEMLIALLTKSPPPEKEDKKTEKLFDMLLNLMLDKKNKGDSLDPLELQRLLNDAEDKGYSRAQEIRALAREEAAHMTGKGGHDEDEDEEPKEEKSTTKLLLETLSPVLAQLAAPRPTIPQVPMRPIQRALPPQRPNLPAAPQQVVRPAPQATPTQPRPVAPQPQVKAAPQGSGNPIAQTTPRVVTQPKPKGTEVKSKKEVVSETVISLIGSDLTSNLLSGKFDPEGTAVKSLEALKPHQVDAKWLLANFTLADMKAVAKEKGIPDSIHEYLDKFYAKINALAAS